MHDGEPVPARSGAGLARRLTTNIVKATSAYEAWLEAQAPPIPADLERKHRAMASDPFVFLRGTAYRWAERWPVVCADVADAPALRTVADLHIENFGTWRDAEGRLVWGVNDLDEAITLPYTNDLVRLVTSTAVAGLALGPKEAASAVIEGYRSALASGGRAFVLAEDQLFLRDLALRSLKDPDRFWGKLRSRAAGDMDGLSTEAIAAAEGLLPEGAIEVTTFHRVAGVGSLGRQRVVAVGRLAGAFVAREAKAVVPSAWTFAGREGASDGLGQCGVMTALGRDAVRSIDPWWRASSGWVVRRLAPDCSRIELGDLPKQRDEHTLLHAMGSETANLHLATPTAAPAILADLDRRDPRWLTAAAEAMAADIVADHQAWVRHMKNAAPVPH